jgi:hypothetical protein
MIAGFSIAFLGFKGFVEYWLVVRDGPGISLDFAATVIFLQILVVSVLLVLIGFRDRRRDRPVVSASLLVGLATMEVTRRVGLYQTPAIQRALLVGTSVIAAAAIGTWAALTIVWGE